MIKRELVPINSNNDYDKLNNLIPPDMVDKTLVENLKQYVGEKCIKVIYEFPYHDRDYLSTFYIFYSKKFKEYKKKCVRLILIGEQDEILGYITLRPTPIGTRIGKTYIEPYYIINRTNGDVYNIILSNHKAHINNEEIMLRCFPWMCQQQDVTVCAHVATWSIIRHYSSISPIYGEILSGDIVDRVQHYERKTPSSGLTPQQISMILMQSGLSTVIHYSKKTKDFFNEMVSYLDSGVPLVGIMAKQEHAVSVIGYVNNKKKLLENNAIDLDFLCETDVINSKKTNVILHGSLVKSLVINDDQCFPYREVPKYENLFEPSQYSNNEYIVADIDCIIVAFYNRIQLTYSDVYSRFMSLNQNSKNNWINSPDDKEPIFVRIFVAPTNKYKSYVEDVWDNQNNVITVIDKMEMPKYIWCIEISSKEHYINNKVDSLLIIDSTTSGLDTGFLFKRDKDGYEFVNPDTHKVEKFSVLPKPWESFSQNCDNLS